jgi:hypothetical protein
MTRNIAGETMVSLSITGGEPTTLYGVHVHDRPCSVANGGGHYKFDTSITEALETNEVWLPVTTDAAGAGMSQATAPSILRADAQALVVHAADNSRLACFDL